MKRGSFWFSLCVSVIFSFGIASAQDMADNDGNGIPDVLDRVLDEVAGCTIPGFEAAPKGVAIEAAAVAAAVELSPSPLRLPDDVNVMPGRQAWIGEGIVVWGNVNSDDPSLTYEWDFGDASSASGNVADPHYIAENHAYASIGPYVATLTVKDSLDNILDSASADVIVMDPALLTDEERLEIDVNQTIQDGLRWLYLDQNLPTGYWEWGDWGTDRPAVTGEAILAFENHGYLPTDDVNVAIYAEYVELGLNYIVSQVQTEAVVAGEPDVNGNGDRAYWTGLSQIRDPLMTGMAMTALVGSGDEASYMTIVEDAVDYLAWAQANDGGWGYGHGSAFNSDNSNAQWPVLGLVGAEIWGIPVPSSVRTNLDSWISAIQNASGASAYQVGGDDNMGMTGALLVEQAFYGDTPGVTRVDDAVTFVDDNWDWTSTGAWNTNHPVNRGANFANYYAMYGIMKGLRLLGVDALTPSGLDWYGDLTRGYAQWLVAEQDAAGWWPKATWTGWEPGVPSTLATSWALLILAPTVIGPQDIDVVLDIKPSSCPNPFNPKSKGVVPFAIVGTMDFDVTLVDPASIILTGPSGVLKAVDEPSYKWEIKDSTEPPPEPDPEEDECYQCFEEYPNMDTDGDGIPDIYVGDGYDDFVFYFDNGAVETILDLDNHNDGDCISVTLMALSTDGIPLVNGEDRFLIRLKGGGPKEKSALVALETAGVYPQPSNPEVWIPYKLNKGFEVSIIIFDSSGRTVRSLELGYREPGAYMSKEKAAYWDGKNEAGEHVSSGIYFCTIKAGDHTATRKIVMMK